MTFDEEDNEENDGGDEDEDEDDEEEAGRRVVAELAKAIGVDPASAVVSVEVRGRTRIFFRIFSSAGFIFRIWGKYGADSCVHNP